jgi:hypothetical protein
MSGGGKTVLVAWSNYPSASRRVAIFKLGAGDASSGFYFLEAEVVLDKGEKFLLDKEPPFWLGRVG